MLMGKLTCIIAVTTQAAENAPTSSPPDVTAFKMAQVTIAPPASIAVTPATRRAIISSCIYFSSG